MSAWTPVFWLGVILGALGLAYLRRRIKDTPAGMMILAAVGAVVVVLIVGGLWAAGQMSTGTPYH